MHRWLYLCQCIVRKASANLLESQVKRWEWNCGRSKMRVSKYLTYLSQYKCLFFLFCFFFLSSTKRITHRAVSWLQYHRLCYGFQLVWHLQHVSVQLCCQFKEVFIIKRVKFSYQLIKTLLFRTVL